VSAGQVVKTIEAVEETEPEAEVVTPVSEAISAAERAEGDEPSLEEVGSNAFETEGTPAESEITTGHEETLVVEGLEGDIEVAPVASPTSPPASEVAEEVAAVSPSTKTGTDTIVRPKFNGLLSFQASVKVPPRKIRRCLLRNR
jgi:hypothetical protein